METRELLEACLRADDRAWREFLKRFHRLIAGTIVKNLLIRGAGTSATDDLVHNVLVKLVDNDYAALRRFEDRGPGSFHGYLKTIAYNAVRDHLRGERPSDEIDPSLGVAPLSDHKRFLMSDAIRILQRWLPESTVARDLTIFRLYFVQDYTAKAISQIAVIGLSEKGVEARIFKMIRMLREEFHARAKGTGSD